MDKAQRAEFLRQRFKKVVGAFGFRASGELKPKRYEPRRTEFRFVYPMGFQGGVGIVGKWVVTADEKTAPTVQPRHRKGRNAIATIAAKQPGKLKRRHATAEGLLSERKQQSRL
jgi:hypothetical protein